MIFVQVVLFVLPVPISHGIWSKKMKTIKRITVLLAAFVFMAITVTSSFAATVYYYFGYLYTSISNDKVSLYGIDDPEMDGLFVPSTLNNKKLVDIRNSAFKDNTVFRYLEFAGATNLERIGSFAFSGCTAIAGEVKIPSNVTTIEVAAFENCTSIEKVVYNASCEYVPNQCFNGCTSLNSVTLSDNVKKIGDYAFANCPNLEYMEITSAVSDISDAAFQNDESLTLGVWYGTAGYDYATKQNIPYVLLDGVKLGDASGDGSVNINDVTSIQRHLAELETLEGIYLHAADANQDGTVDIADATVIQMYLAEYEMEYPIGEVMTQ